MSSQSLKAKVTNFQLLMFWIKTAWPVLAAIVIAFYMYDVIVQSIVSTQYPEIILFIILVAAIAAALILWIQARSTLDIITIRGFIAGDLKKRTRYASGRSVYARIFGLLNDQRELGLGSRLQIISEEVRLVEDGIDERSDMPTFLSSGLVGLGLAGTFIGLLAALSELSAVFSLLSGGANDSPSEMFTQMITQLQEPMRSMGTAFATSLYGLLLSLVVTLMLLGVRSTATASKTMLQIAMHEAEFGQTMAEKDANEYKDVEFSTVLERIEGLSQYHEASMDAISQNLLSVSEVIGDLAERSAKSQAEQTRLAEAMSLALTDMGLAALQTRDSQMAAEVAIDKNLAEIQSRSEQVLRLQNDQIAAGQTSQKEFAGSISRLSSAIDVLTAHLENRAPRT